MESPIRQLLVPKPFHLTEEQEERLDADILRLADIGNNRELLRDQPRLQALLAARKA